MPDYVLLIKLYLQQMVPIFHKLYETSRTSKSLALTSYAGIESGW